MSMAPEVVGAYIRLLCYAWMNGGIPGDMAALQRITGGITQEGWDEIRARLVVDGDRDGDRSGDRVQTWVHPRMERERERTDKIRKARQDAAIATNSKRKHGDRTADRDGDRAADRPYPQPQPQDNPPLSPPSRKGGRRRMLKEIEQHRNDPNWTPF